MALPIDDLGAVGAIPVIGPIVLGVIGIIDLVAAIFGWTFGGGDTTALANAINTLSTAVSAAINQLTWFAWAIAYALGKVLQWIHDLLVGFIQTMWSLLKKLAAMVKDVITNLLPKILGIIKTMRDFLQYVYIHYIRIALLYLQYIRQFLAILRLFHVAFAAKLDKYLVQIQSLILTPFLYVLRSINGIGSWINLIITAQGLIQRAVFINTMWAYQSDWIPMWWTGQTRVGPLPPTTPTTGPNPPPTPTAVAPDVYQWVTTGTGSFEPDSQLAISAALEDDPTFPVLT